MKQRTTNRIHLPQQLPPCQPIVLSGKLAHYLSNVLRLKVNNKIRVFNDNIGEWLANISECDKKASYVKLSLEEQLRAPTPSPELSIAPCIIKSDRFASMLDMATQLGATKIIPLISSNTSHNNLNMERIERILTEAAEQSERLHIPALMNAVKLPKLNYAAYDAVIYADEKSSPHDMPDFKVFSKNILLITGPEGGFNKCEFDFLATLPNSHKVNLGANILRAETAMVKLISLAQFARSSA